MRLLRTLALPLALVLLSSGCFGYRLMRPEELEIPNYNPRLVQVPAECATLIDRAVQRGMNDFNEREVRMVDFCQQQEILRAAEEETAARRLDAHARAADFALQLTVTVLTGVIAVLAWVF